MSRGQRVRRASFGFVMTICGGAFLAGCQSQSPNDAVPQGQAGASEEAQALSPLQRALYRGMKPSGDLAKELSELQDVAIESRDDAEAICNALRKLSTRTSERREKGPSDLVELAGLFENAKPDSPALESLRTAGLPLLIQIYDAQISAADDAAADDLLYVLMILARHESRDGVDRIIAAARKPLKADSDWWRQVLTAFSPEHAHRDYLFEALSNPLPTDSIAHALATAANIAALRGPLPRHPFDSPAGCERLRSWLENHDPDEVRFAYTATVALAFLANPLRDGLFETAGRHPEVRIQIEAAWAGGKLGREAGFKALVQFCQDVKHSEVARNYLIELKRDDLIPAVAKEPPFRARATFAEWLAHPDELGRPPDVVEIVDQRQLAWPPSREPKPFWLLRYRVIDPLGLAEDDVGCGLVGSTTWCFFTYHMHERPPEDAYAIHCYGELRGAELITEKEVNEAFDVSEILGQWPGDPLEEPKIALLADVSPTLNIPSTKPAVASARVKGQEGWAVIDGPRSAWYPKAEQPAGTRANVVLMIHVGRQLLGFTDQPQRAKFLAPPIRREPQQIVEAYEKILDEASHAESRQLLKLLDHGSPLERHFDRYVDAVVAVKGVSKPDAVIELFDRLRQFAERADPSVRTKIHSSLGVLSERFGDYIDALVSRGRLAKIPGIIESFAPHWDHNRGYGQLGEAAFKAGRMDVAERYFVKLREGMERHHTTKHMSQLAEIWQKRGESQQAQELLEYCLQELANDMRNADSAESRDRIDAMFRLHLATYSRLFPDRKLLIPAQPGTDTASPETSREPE